MAVYQRIAQAGDPTSFTFGYSASDYDSGTLLDIAGASSSTPLDAFAAQYVSGPNNTPSTYSTPTVTASHDNDLAIAYFTIQKQNAASASSGAGWVQNVAAANTYKAQEMQTALSTASGQTMQASVNNGAVSAEYGYSTVVLVQSNANVAISQKCCRLPQIKDRLYTMRRLTRLRISWVSLLSM